jgi:glutamine amidotransferase
MKISVCIIDYGLGNISSLVNMCKKIGEKASVSNQPDEINNATHLILPGVGAFDIGMKNLIDRGLDTILKKQVIDNKVPILGICLGAQLMLSSSDEGSQDGLGWIDGKVVRFNDTSGIKIPHMGWNSISRIYDLDLFKGMPDSPPRFYFVHSYHFHISNPSEIVAQSTYGYDFAVSFKKGNIIGVQFHPEKSHQFGMHLLTNFFNIK